MKIFGVIDVGTNSVKLHLSEQHPDGTWTPIADRSEITRLGEGLLHTGELAQAAMTRTAAAVAAMVTEARRAGVSGLAVVGTMGLRTASNRDTFLTLVRDYARIDIEVISGEEEGRLGWLAVQSGIGAGEGSLVIFDSGGGSSQFTFGLGTHVDERFSVAVGAVRYMETFGLSEAVPAERVTAALGAIAADLARLDGRPVPDALVGMGGTVTTMAAVMHGLARYDPDLIQGSVLARSEVARQIELYRSRSVGERRLVVGLQPSRADVILAGACIVATVMDRLRQDVLTVSERGLRHGVLVDRFGRG